MERFNYYSNEMHDLPFCVHCKGDVSVPGPTPEETQYQQMQMEDIKTQRAQSAMLKPYLYQMAGVKEVDGKIVPMTEEEQLSGMTAAQKSQYDVSKLQNDQYSKALKGELPLSQAVEGEIAKQRSELESYMSRKLGPNWKQSTPGIQSLAEFDKKTNALREEQQYGKLSSAGAMNIQQNEYMNQMMGRSAQGVTSPLQMNQGLFGMYGQAMQPYQQQRAMQFQGNQANAQNSSEMMSGLGSLLGTGIMAGGTALSGGGLAALMGAGAAGGGGAASTFLDPSYWAKM
jgi:hypothetical protein